MNIKQVKQETNTMNTEFQSQDNSQSEEYSFKVGNISSQGVTLVDNDYNIIKLPYSMLPRGSKSGSIISITFRRDYKQQQRQREQLNQLVRRLQTGNNDHFVDYYEKNNADLNDDLEEKQIDNGDERNKNKNDQQSRKYKINSPIQNPMKKKSVAPTHKQSFNNQKQPINRTSSIAKKSQHLSKLK